MGVSLKNAMISGIAGIIFCVAVSTLLIEVKAVLNYRESLLDARASMTAKVVQEAEVPITEADSNVGGAEFLYGNEFTCSKAEVIATMLYEYREYPYYVDDVEILPDEYALTKLETIIPAMKLSYTRSYVYDEKGRIAAVYFYGK